MERKWKLLSRDLGLGVRGVHAFFGLGVGFLDWSGF